MTEMIPQVWICPYCKSTFKSPYPAILEAMKENHYKPDEFTGEPICDRLQVKRR